MTLSGTELEGYRVLEKSLFRLALPDIELGRCALFIAGVPGMEEEGVSSPLSKSPSLWPPGPRLSRKIELSRSSTSFFLGVDGRALG